MLRYHGAHDEGEGAGGRQGGVRRGDGGGGEQRTLLDQGADHDQVRGHHMIIIYMICRHVSYVDCGDSL